MIHRAFLLAFVMQTAGVTESAAQQSQGCFAGTDAAGAPARMILQAERVGESFEVWGQISSRTIGVMQIKADGWSGAGRLFRGHEYESGALFIRITNYSAQGFVLEVQDYGRFPFSAVPC
ncbi:hypothetical protein [Mesorhizobium sp. CN2-181]|uniref:hypothetical protein n=1 Tax=Mesorhizobium yinganensis TaxID=3157707 RepID=UPI0032B7918C